MTSRWARLRADCGGAQFLALRSQLIAVPFVLITSVLSSTPSDASTALLWLLANVIAVAVTAVPVIGLRLLRRRTDRLVPFTLVLLTGAAVGAVKGAATAICGSGLGLVTDLSADLIARALNAALLGAWGIATLAALHAGYRRWQHEREVLVGELTRRAIAESNPVADAHRHALVDAVEQTRRELEAAPAGSAAAVVRRSVDARFRPLSSRLLADTSSSVSGTSSVSGIGDLVRVAVRAEPVPARVPAIVFGLSTWPVHARYTDALESSGRSLLAAIVLLVVIAAANRVVPRRPVIAETGLLATAVATTVLYFTISDASFGRIAELHHVAMAATMAIWILEVTVATSVVRVARRERDVIHRRLLALLGPEGIRETVDERRRRLAGRDLAYFVHGDVQNRLLAAARHIDDADDALTRQEAVDDVHRILGDALAAITAMAKTDARTRLDDLVERWRGFATIELRLADGGDLLGSPAGQRAAEVVVEGVTNAIRHGHAERIVVDVHRTDDPAPGVVVEIADDGVGPQRGRHGTGLAYVDMVSSGRWSLDTASGGGSVLRVELPLD